MIRTLTSIFLIILIISGTSREMLIYASFKLNQKYIAENLCVDKDKPMSQCSGNCYLKEQLEKTREKEMESPMPRYEYSLPIQFIENKIDEDNLYFNTLSKKGYSQLEITFHIEKHTTDIFHPPKS